MNVPEAAARAASRLAARAIEALEAARRIRDEPQRAIESIPRTGSFNRFGELFGRAAAFPWGELDSSLAIGGYPVFVESRRSSTSRRAFFGLPKSDEAVEIDFFGSAGKPTKVAIAVVRRWAAEIVELGEQVLGQAAGDGPPDAESLVVTERERDFYKLLVEAGRRGRGVRGAAAIAELIRRHNVHGSTLTFMKKRLNAALGGTGWAVTHSKRLGYHLARA